MHYPEEVEKEEKRLPYATHPTLPPKTLKNNN